MKYLPNQIASIITADGISKHDSNAITNIIIDSRSISCNKSSLFFALVGDTNNGHNYIKDLIIKGVKYFVISDKSFIDDKATYFLVNNTTTSLQKLASHHRKQFSIPVIGITGSNGKTIVKEWLSTSLETTETPIKTIGSYNSQVGVPLSIFQLDSSHTTGIFEAGISKKGEMTKLQHIINPSIGILTNIGSAHAFGFESKTEKIKEKIQLFKNCEIVICNEQWKGYLPENKLFVWGKDRDVNLSYHLSPSTYQLSLVFKGTKKTYSLAFTDQVSLENLMQVLAFHVWKKQSVQNLQQIIDQVRPVSMRLEVKKGINNSLLIDDTYNNDPEGMKRALSFLSNQDKRLNRSAIITGYLGTKTDYTELNKELKRSNVQSLHLIGEEIHQAHFDLPYTTYQNVSSFLENIDSKQFKNNVVLIKGARKYRLEQIVEHFQKEFHETVLEINLSALQHNLNYFRSKLSLKTKIMAMVKAYAYGAGATTVAQLMQYNNIDYLGVAYVDEGVDLRSNGIETPIMVMNPTDKSTHKFLEYNLEPEIYSLTQLERLIISLNGKPLKIHLKIDTGMHRLGFSLTNYDDLIPILQKNDNLTVSSIFTHLAAADNPEEDGFTLDQISTFELISRNIKSALQISPIIHVLNSAGVQRFPKAQFDMVRLGIGIYGVGVDDTEQNQLEHIGVLKTRISQIKHIPKNQTIGYSRAGKIKEDTTIATIAIGYADGYDRRFSKGIGKVLVNGKLAKVVGNVCMDMTMIDITTITAKEGDEVILFSNELPVSELAKSIGTIPYEILTSVSERVKRVFIRE